MEQENVAEEDGRGTVLFGPYDFTGTDADVWPSICSNVDGLVARLPPVDDWRISVTLSRPCDHCAQPVQFTLTLESADTVSVTFPEHPRVQHRVCPPPPE